MDGFIAQTGKSAVAKAAIRLCAWLALLIIIVLSVVPGSMRPSVVASDYYEHFTAYFIAGGLLATGYSRLKQMLLSAIMLSLCGGTLEIIQLWIVDRTASAGEFAASACGAWTAFFFAYVVKGADIGTKTARDPLPK